MKIQLKRINEDYLFECSNQNGHSVLLDNVRLPNPKGVSPMENLLMAMAGCSAIDMISILKKQRQTITDFQAEVEGERIEEGDAKPFKHINVKFILTGEIDAAKAQRAAQLSFEKYCSVSKTLNPTITIDYEVEIHP